MFKENYITYVFSLKVPVGNTHMKDVNAFFWFLAEVRKIKNQIIVYLQ